MSKNDVTGDRLVSKITTDAFRNNFDVIFGKKDMRQICYWADGTWCDLENYPSYRHMSDDIRKILVSFDYTDKEVEHLVQAAIKCG